MADFKFCVVLVFVYICICENTCFVFGGQPLSQPPEIYSLHITSDVKYRFATTLITSRVKNPDTTSREAVFDVTLPNEAFITNFTLEIDGRIVVGEVKEKQAAKQQYDAARARGESAGYIGTQHRNTNKFNLAVTVAPSSKVNFNLTYQELLKRRHGHYEQVIYIDPGQPVPDMDVTISILESREITELVVPPLRNDIDVNIEESNSIVVVEQPTPTTAYIKYIPNVEHQTAISSHGIAGQFVVKYDVARDMDGGDLLVVNGYFVHFFAPVGFSPIPKDVLFILDTSGSMVGRRISQLREAMTSILDQLREGDRINIMTFSGSNSFWKTEMMTVGDAGVLEAAKRHVTSLSASGWTNINSALTSGLEFLASRAQPEGEVRSPLLVFLTDGEATQGVRDTPTILRHVQVANEGEVPIFSLAFGAHADYDLVKKVAVQNYGLGRKIFEAADAAIQISGFYDEISATLLNDVTFKYLDAPVSNVTKHKYKNYFNGSEVVVCGRIADLTLVDEKGMTLEVHGNGVNGPSILLASNFSMNGAFDYMNNMTGVGDYEKITEKVWAYLTIKQLLDKELAATDQDEKDGYNRQVLELSLKYGFVTPLTSMVVTLDNEQTEEHTEAVYDEAANFPSRPVVPPNDPSSPIQPRTMIMNRDRGPPPMYSGISRSQSSRGQSANARGVAHDDPPAARRFYSPSMMAPPPPPVAGAKLAYNNNADSDIGGSNVKVTGGAHRRHRKKLGKHRKKGAKKSMDLPLKVNMTSLEVPVCFNLYDGQHPDSGQYVMYSSPSRGVSVLATVEMVTARRWFKRGVVVRLEIRTPNTSTNITSQSYEHVSKHLTENSTTWAAGLELTVPDEITIIQGNPNYMKVDLVDMSMVIGRSNVTDRMSIYVSRYGNVNSDVTGIIGEIISRHVSVVVKAKAKANRRKTKRPRKQRWFGLLKLRGSQGKFTALMRRMTTQGVDQSENRCWVPRKNERRFFTIANYRV